MVTERKDTSAAETQPVVHPELMRARTFTASLKKEWRPLFDEPLALAVQSFARVRQEEGALAGQARENEERLRLAMAQRETALESVSAAQDELATGQSPEQIKARVQHTLSAPHVEQRTLGRILRLVYGTDPEPSSSLLAQAQAEATKAAEQLIEAERLHAARQQELTERQVNVSRRPATLVHQLHDRMKQIAARDQELTIKYISAFPENAIKAADTFAETHVDDPAIIERYFPDFFFEALHQKDAAKRTQPRSLYQRLGRKQPGEPIDIADLTRKELMYWIDYISYRFLKDCWREEDSHLRQIMPEPTVPRLL